MNVEYTGRQYEATPAVRKQIDQGLSKLKKSWALHSRPTSFWRQRSIATSPKLLLRCVPIPSSASPKPGT